MAKYAQFETVRLKDGRIGAITDVYEAPGIPVMYLVDVGTSPKDWNNISVGDEGIERLATLEEMEKEYLKSRHELKEMGLWDDK